MQMLVATGLRWQFARKADNKKRQYDGGIWAGKFQ